jgi:hypothetical protein
LQTQSYTRLHNLEKNSSQNALSEKIGQGVLFCTYSFEMWSWPCGDAHAFAQRSGYNSCGGTRDACEIFAADTAAATGAIFGAGTAASTGAKFTTA